LRQRPVSKEWGVKKNEHRITDRGKQREGGYGGWERESQRQKLARRLAKGQGYKENRIVSHERWKATTGMRENKTVQPLDNQKTWLRQ